MRGDKVVAVTPQHTRQRIRCFHRMQRIFLFSVYLEIDSLFYVVGDVFLDDSSYSFLDFRTCSEEAAAWDVDCCSCFFEREELPELRFVGELYGSLVVASVSVFLSSEGACCLVVFVPEEAFHLLRDDDFSPVVVYFGVWQIRVKDDGVI